MEAEECDIEYSTSNNEIRRNVCTHSALFKRI